MLELVVDNEREDPSALALIAHNEFEHNTGIVSGAALSLFSGVNSGVLSSSGTFCGGFIIRGNTFVGNAVLLKGGVVRHECSRSDLTSLNYHPLHEHYSDTPSAEEKWLDWDLLSLMY